MCTQCERSARPGDECEYTDTGRTRTQVLEENVARLEARIRELEEPHDEQAVRLHDPYHHHQQVQDHRRSSSLPGLAQSGAHPQSPGGQLSPAISQPDSNPASSRGTPSTHSPAPSSAEHILEEPSISVIQLLLHHFLPHASQFGFFLNPGRFLESALRPLPMGDPNRPCPALLTAVYLWGAHLARSDPYAALEPTFLSRALLNAANGISSDHPKKILNGIQASVLLSQYFFKIGRILEAKYHLSAAISLVSGYRLHQIPAATPPVVDLFGLSTPFLPPATDRIEEGERINAFWTVYHLNNCWGVALGSPAGNLDGPGFHVNVPWPLDVEQYEQNLVPPPPLQGVHTVEAFLSQGAAHPDPSMLSLFVKASVLFERASNVNARLQNSVFPHVYRRFGHGSGYAFGDHSAHLMSPADLASTLHANELADQFSSLDALIESFKVVLPSMGQVEMTMPMSVRLAFVTHTLVHVSVIQLHSGLAGTNVHSQQRTLAAAEAVFDIITSTGNLQSFGQINPIVGTLWTRAAQVIVGEISRMRALRATWGGLPTDKERELADVLERGLAAMAWFAGDSQLMGYQLSKLQAEYSSI